MTGTPRAAGRVQIACRAANLGCATGVQAKALGRRRNGNETDARQQS